MSFTAAQWLNFLWQLQPFQPNPIIPLQCSSWPEVSSGAFISLQRSMAAVSATEWISVLLCTTVFFQHMWNTILQPQRNWDLEELCCSCTNQICTTLFTGFGLHYLLFVTIAIFYKSLTNKKKNSQHVYEIFFSKCLCPLLKLQSVCSWMMQL